MFTDEDLPPAPRFKVSRWLLSGLMAWSLFFGAIGGLAILLMADAFFDIPYQNEHRELPDNNQVEEQVTAVDQRVTALERQTRQLKVAQSEVANVVRQPDTQLAKILIGMTQLKTAYDSDASLQSGIDTLKQSIKDVHLQAMLSELSALTQNNFPTKEKIILDLNNLKSAEQKKANPRNNPELGWQERATEAISQWVSVTPTSEITDGKLINQLEQAVTSGNFALANKYAEQLPKNQASENVSVQLKARLKAQSLVQNIIGQVSNAVGQATQGSIY